MSAVLAAESESPVAEEGGGLQEIVVSARRREESIQSTPLSVSAVSVADLEAKVGGVVQVLLDVTLGVDDDRSRSGLVSQKIGGVGKTAQIILFQNHRRCISLHLLKGEGVG